MEEMFRPHPGPLPRKRERDGSLLATNTLARVRSGDECGRDLVTPSAFAAPPLLGERAGVRADLSHSFSLCWINQ
jgi:hypothetical protein